MVGALHSDKARCTGVMIPATPQREWPPRRMCAAAAAAFLSKATVPEPELDDTPDLNLNDAAASVQPHRKRGRPRKRSVEGPGDAAAETPKRKRGRPRKVCVAAVDEAKAAAVPERELDGLCSGGLPSLELPMMFSLTPPQTGTASPFRPWSRRAFLKRTHAYCFLAVRSRDQ